MPFKSDNFAALKRRYTRYSIRTAMFFDWHNRRGWNRKIIMCALIVFFTIYIPLIIYHLRATRDKQVSFQVKNFNHTAYVQPIEMLAVY